MHPRTGAIAEFETDEDAKKAGYTVKLTPGQVKQFGHMNRKERLAELSRQRRAKRKKK